VEVSKLIFASHRDPRGTCETR